MNFNVYKIISIPTIITQGTAIALVPHIAADIANKDKEKTDEDIRISFCSCILFFLPIVTFMGVFAKETYYVMYGLTNADLGSYILRWALIRAFFFMLSSLSFQLMVTMHLSWQSIIAYVFGLLMNFLFLEGFIIRSGIKGDLCL